MSKFCIHVREDKTIISFSDEHFCFKNKAPLAYRPIEVWVYHGYNFLGIIRNGYIHCSTWQYKIKCGRELIVVCQIEDD